ncbi:hypothetical protein DSO57_1037854 [Entomophthora muscae]|uniref:Uncharacterized protein n=1 Tax=Entomophthora muscae TaxID=34485 RepID=A0ACC2S136_9FUNG|nr:hypothetical protein DSO57_1037854 [Entomophthora muscae]
MGLALALYRGAKASQSDKTNRIECKQHFRKCNPEKTAILKCVDGHYDLIKCDPNKSCSMRFRVTACR